MNFTSSLPSHELGNVQIDNRKPVKSEAAASITRPGLALQPAHCWCVPCTTGEGGRGQKKVAVSFGYVGFCLSIWGVGGWGGEQPVVHGAVAVDVHGGHDLRAMRGERWGGGGGGG